MIDRVFYEVRPIRGFIGWQLVRDGHVQRYYLFKSWAVKAAATECRFDWDVYRIPAELMIKGKDGRVKDSRTYGLDPPGTAG